MTSHSGHAYEGSMLCVDRLIVSGREREIVRHGPTVGALLRLSPDEFVFVLQHRHAVDEVTLEIVGGKQEPGEGPEAAAHREVLEETGYNCLRLELLGEVWPAPGYLDERVTVFLADAQSPPGPRAEMDESRITPVIMSVQAFTEALHQGKVRDGKTLGAWLLMTANVERTWR